MSALEDMMRDIDIKAAMKDERMHGGEEREDSNKEAKMAKCEIAEVAIKRLRTLDTEADRLDVCSNMMSIFDRLSMFAAFGNELLFQKHLDRLEEAIESSRKGE